MVKEAQEDTRVCQCGEGAREERSQDQRKGLERHVKESDRG